MDKLFSLIKQSTQKLIWDYFWDNFQLPKLNIEQVISLNKIHTPIITEKICLPPYYGDPMFHDYSYMISLIDYFKPQTLLELGTAHGNTVVNICLNFNCNILTVNALPHQIEGKGTTFSLSKDEIGSVYKKHGFEKRVRQIYMNTKNLSILDFVEQGAVDFAIIDACHDSEFVVNDFLRIFPSLSNNAVVLFHDTNPSLNLHLIDSYIGCMYLRKKGFDVKYFENSSWGFWRADHASINFSKIKKLTNFSHTCLCKLFYGNEDKIIRNIRWLASGFLRNKFRS